MYKTRCKQIAFWHLKRSDTSETLACSRKRMCKTSMHIHGYSPSSPPWVDSVQNFAVKGSKRKLQYTKTSIKRPVSFCLKTCLLIHVRKMPKVTLKCVAQIYNSTVSFGRIITDKLKISRIVRRVLSALWCSCFNISDI